MSPLVPGVKLTHTLAPLPFSSSSPWPPFARAVEFFVVISSGSRCLKPATFLNFEVPLVSVEAEKEEAASAMQLQTCRARDGGTGNKRARTAALWKRRLGPRGFGLRRCRPTATADVEAVAAAAHVSEGLHCWLGRFGGGRQALWHPWTSLPEAVAVSLTRCKAIFARQPTRGRLLLGNSQGQLHVAGYPALAAGGHAGRQVKYGTSFDGALR